MTNRYLIGNAQTIGKREVQSNYFSTTYNAAGDLFAVLTDGTIDHPNGRKAAVLAVHYCARAFADSGDKWNDHSFMETALRVNRYIQDHIYTDQSPQMSLLMAIFNGYRLHYFNVGANQIFLYNGHSEHRLENAHCINGERKYSAGNYELSRKDIVGLLSRGAYAHNHPMERMQALSSGNSAFDKAQAMVEGLNAKGLDNQLNTTVILVEVAK